jgi:hypothetical protein
MAASTATAPKATTMTSITTNSSNKTRAQVFVVAAPKKKKVISLP